MSNWRNPLEYPSAHKLAGILKISEEKQRWIKGSFVLDPEVACELSFELTGVLPTFLTTRLTYIGAWRHRRTLIEYQEGRLCHVPDDATWRTLIVPLVERLGSYMPVALTRDAFDALQRDKNR